MSKYYVNNTTGSNGNAGTKSAPWATIAYGLTQVIPGDTLLIQEGTYNEILTLSVNGTAKFPITVEGLGTVTCNTESISQPVFDTNGINYYRFKNFTVSGSQSFAQVEGSHDIYFEGLDVSDSRFILRIDNSYNISGKDIEGEDLYFGIRGLNAAHHIYFKNVKVSYCQDPDGSASYLNGDGFIFENDVDYVTLEECISFYNWDAGFDVKGDNILLKNCSAFGNKNNFKLWGQANLVKCFGHHGVREADSGGGSTEGNGITVETGGNVVATDCLFIDNEDHDIAVYTGGAISLVNCITARKTSVDGLLVELSGTGTLTSSNCIWYDESKELEEVEEYYEIPSGDTWGERPALYGWSDGWVGIADSTIIRGKSGSRVKFARF